MAEYDYAKGVAEGHHIGAGWRPMVLELIELCKKHNVSVHQIKEKFGGLRFYTSAAPQGLQQLIWAAEMLSNRICEECGANGEHRDVDWIKTLCDRCFEKARLFLKGSEDHLVEHDSGAQ